MIRREQFKGGLCSHGVNQGIPYNKEQPCEPGEEFVEFLCDCWKPEPLCDSPVAIQVLSYVSTTGINGAPGGGQISSWIFADVPPGAFGRVEARGDKIEVYFDGEWREVGVAPFMEGQEFEGEKIMDVIHYVTVSPNCA